MTKRAMIVSQEQIESAVLVLRGEKVLLDADLAAMYGVTTGALNGDTWTWTGSSNYNGMTIQSRMIIKVVSSTSYTSKYEVSADGGANWMPFWDGKATKK